MLRDIISEREEQLPLLTIGRLLKIAAEDKSIISLGPGEPDFDSPPHIRRAAKKCMDMKCTHYSPTGGRADLKEAIIKKLSKENNISLGPENIIVTTGSTEAILLALACTIDPGEGVLIPDPGFLSYKPTVEVLNGMPLSVPLLEKDGFEVNVEEMEQAIVPEKTRVLIMNTPSNPTGTVFSKKVLEGIAGFAVEHDLLIISDEAYEKFVYDDARHVSIGSLNGMGGRVLTLHSFSKTYAMPGFRLGYAAGPEKVVGAMTRLHIITTLCAPTMSQVTGIEALKGDQRPVERMRREYDRRRRMVVRRVNEIPGFLCTVPKGAFYAFPNIKSFGMKSLEFSERLIKGAKVAVVPGTEFGKFGEGYIRLSYATGYDLIEKALDRIEREVKKPKRLFKLDPIKLYHGQRQIL
jgi:aminotransferase